MPIWFFHLSWLHLFTQYLHHGAGAMAGFKISGIKTSQALVWYTCLGDFVAWLGR
jgi:hypothetical protein